MALQKIALLRQLYDSEPDPAFGFDGSLRVAWLNPACEQVFPELVEGMYLQEGFPDFGLEALRDTVRDRGAGVFQNRRDGSESIAVVCYGRKESPFYVGSYRGFCTYRVDPQDAESAGGVQLMSYYVRKRVFGIFNQLDLLAEQMEETGSESAADSIARVEDGCLALLRLCTDLSVYYRRDETPVLAPVPMGNYLLRIMQELDFRLIPAGVRLDYEIDCGNAVCMLDRDRIAIGILNMLAASVRYCRSSGIQNGVFTCRCKEADGELRLLLSDTCSVFSELRSAPSAENFLKLDVTGELFPLKRVGYEILERAVEDSGGSCLLENSSPGIRILIRLPILEDRPELRVEDEPVYTAQRDMNGRTSLVNIMLADLF